MSVTPPFTMKALVVREKATGTVVGVESIRATSCTVYIEIPTSIFTAGDLKRIRQDRIEFDDMRTAAEELTSTPLVGIGFGGDVQELMQTDWESLTFSIDTFEVSADCRMAVNKSIADTLD